MRAYANMTPEQRSEYDGMITGCLFVILALAVLFGLVTGDWNGVGKWLTR